MRVRISKWGNSLAVRLPKELADRLTLRSGETVEIEAVDDGLTLRKLAPIARYRLEDLVAEARRLGLENEPPYEDWGMLPSEWPPYLEEGNVGKSRAADDSKRGRSRVGRARPRARS